MTPVRALVSGVLINLGLGTFYAWSVFVTPYEGVLEVSRTEISSVFSLATICFVASMLIGPLLHARLKASTLALVSTLMGALGLALAGWASSLTVVLVGYGLLFGTANGLGYALSLQVVSHAFKRRRALALGLVVAAYALGAVAAAPILSALIPRIGLPPTLYGLAVFILAVGFIVAHLLRGPGPLSEPRQDASPSSALVPEKTGMLFARMWTAYALGATAGLMMIGHAAGIVSDSGGSASAVILGPVVVSIGNGLGRISAGWLGDILPVRWVLSAATGIGAAVLLVSVILPTAVITLIALAVMGTAYGILAAGYPVGVSHYFGPQRVAAVYGRLFTAWGAGGVVGPYMAAKSFEMTGGYGVAMIFACGAAILASVCTAFLPQPASCHPQRPGVARSMAEP